MEISFFNTFLNIRFETLKEPLGFAGSMNFYVYADGDSVNFVDVSGLKPGDCYYSYSEVLKDAGDSILEEPMHFLFEFATTIYITEDNYERVCYSYTELSTNYDPKHVTPTYPFYISREEVDGIIHNHPEDEDFGDDDKNAAKAGLRIFKIKDNGVIEELNL